MSRRPFDGQVIITTEYHEAEPGSRRGYHTGVDYAMPQGTPILSPTNGTIHQNGDGTSSSDGRGYFVTIVGDDGVGHCLYHLSRMGTRTGHVNEGDLVGYSGNTGQSTGPHLHWETRRGVDDNQSDFAPGTWLFAGQSAVNVSTTASPTPRTTAMVRFFGDYRTGRNTPGGAPACKIAPANYPGGYLDYAIKDRSGDWVQVTTGMFGDKWFYVGPDQGAAGLTQYFNQ